MLISYVNDECDDQCDNISNIKDKLFDKNDEFQQLQTNYHQQENKVIKGNNLSTENEQLHSENQALLFIWTIANGTN